jgi:hypothetical protein
MINFLRVIFIMLFLFMIYTVVSTSLESNLIKEWSNLAQIPWMSATLIDFYINTVVIFIWIAYKENRLITKVYWLLGLIFLGSIASTLYMIIQLYKINSNDSLEKLFIRNDSAKDFI